MTKMKDLPRTAETAHAHYTLRCVLSGGCGGAALDFNRPATVCVKVQPMDGRAFEREFHPAEWVEFCKQNPPTPPRSIDGENGKLFLDWGVKTELRYVCRDDLGSILATFPADVTAADVVKELRSMGIPSKTRIKIRKQEVDLDGETGALIDA